MTDLQRNTISNLFEGRAEPPNETIDYLIGRSKDVHAEHTAVLSNIEHLKRRVEELHHRRIELEAIQRQYLADLEFWLQKEQDAAESKQEVSDGEPEPRSDQHSDDESRAPEKVADGVGPVLVSVQREGPGGCDRNPRGEGDGGNRDDVQRAPEDTGDRAE